MSTGDDRLDAFLATPEPSSLPEPPGAYRAGLTEFDGTTGTIGTGTRTTPIGDWSEILSVWGLDPAVYEIVGDTVRMSAWEVARKGEEPTRLYAYRAQVRHRLAVHDTTDLASVLAKLDAWKPTRPLSRDDRPALVVPLSDWQAGKGEGGGTPALLDRLMGYLDQIEERARRERPSEIVLVGLGDLVEGCTGHYPMQTWAADLDQREQTRFVRRVIVEYVLRLGRKYPLTVLAVPGNHGENRLNGKAFTTWSDNVDVAVFEQAAEIVHDRPQLQRVTFHLATELEIVHTICGVPVGAFHGHGPKAPNAKQLWDYMGRSALSGRPIGRVQILLTGHYHHTVLDESVMGTWIQVPAADGGSFWYTASTGNQSRQGQLSLLIGTQCGARGWSGVEIY